MTIKIFYRLVFGLLIFQGIVSECRAEQVNVAVASNALAAIKLIADEFEKQFGHTVRISSGSTGKLYAQIVNGAPFDLFFAANEKEPEKLEQSGLTVPNSRFTYAVGKLVAWSANVALLKATSIKNAVASNSVTRIAIANPKIAPYGLAAQQALQKMGIWESLQTKIIRGENITQTYQFVVTNNAQIGFVAKSQIQQNIEMEQGSFLEVAEDLYMPIRQQAVLLQRAQHNKAARDFIDMIKSDSVKGIFTKQFGYGMISNQENN